MQVIGFGATSEGGSTSNVLKKLDTEFQRIASCQGTYPGVEFATHVCGNVDNAGDCQGEDNALLVEFLVHDISTSSDIATNSIFLACR